MRPRSNLVLSATAGLGLLIMPAAAFAQGTEEQQQACTPDALKLCSDAIPDIGKTTACMKAHYSQLSPRCQTAFHDATGGAKTPVRKAVEASKNRVATRNERATADHRPSDRRSADRHLAERAMPERRLPERETAARETVPPARDAAVPPVAAGFPPFPSPDAPIVHATSTPSPIANACRAGLIDSFTCSTTVPALLGAAVQ